MSDLRPLLNEISNKHGELTAAAVVAEASAADHPLHAMFEWDDKVAGHEYRLSQARALIRRVVIVDEGRELRAFPFVRSAARYAPLQEVLENADWRDEVIAEFRRAAKAFEARWKSHSIAAAAFQEWASAQVEPASAA